MKSLAARPCRASFGRSSHSGVLKLVAGLLALAVLLTGCAQTTAAPAPKATATPAAIPTIASTPTITPLPSAPLLWRQVTLPSNAPGAAVAVAPRDGATVYACAAPHPTGSQIEWPRVWVTHDYAAHWTQMTSIPADHANNGCAITVDQLNPSIAVAVLTLFQNGANHPNIQDSTNYVTYNGGASWRKLTDPQPLEMSFLTGTATRNTMTYAIRDILSGNVFHTGLWVSSDHMATWRLIDPPTGGVDAVTFWLHPTTGELLALYGEFQGQSSLWDSADGGAHWTQIDAPTRMTPGALQHPYLAEPLGARPGWTLCTTDVGVAGDVAANPLTCSVDGGKTWGKRPVLVPRQSGASDAQQTAFAFGASDGTILATLSIGSATTVYRLTPGAQQWQSLGDLPFAMSYASLAGGTVIWSASGSPLSPVVAAVHS